VKIAIGSDHGGFLLKEEIKKGLALSSIEYVDFGAFDENPHDYPDIAKKAVNAILSNKVDRGILICGTGIGMTIQANRFIGIRAALCYSEYTAQMSRKHNNSNILVLGGRTMDKDIAIKILNIWLTTNFEGGKHKRRIDKIDE
jgi:ribose 5-phosphate isomerase B